jgi:hypothetical protein
MPPSAGSKDSSTSVTVPRCALVMGLPDSKDGFCRTDPPSDYAMTMFNGTPTSAWPRYARSVERADLLARTARELGFTVYREGGLDALTEATARHDAVVVFGHSRSATFAKRDFQGADGADRRATVIARLGRSDVSFAPLLNRFGAERPETLLQALNGAIVEGKPFCELPPDKRPATGGSLLLERVLSREMIDAAIGDLVEPGNTIELHGRLHGFGAVVQAVHYDFSGELALIVCHSTALATAIEQRFGMSLRLASWGITLLPDGFYALVEAALRQVHRQGGSLLDALRGLDKMLLGLVGEE